MNKKIALVAVLCLGGAVGAFAQGWKKLPKLSNGAGGAAKNLERLSSQVERMAKMANLSYVKKSSLSNVVNGYLRTPNVSHFTLANGVAVRAVRFSRNIMLEKENLFVPAGSLAVVGPKGDISIYQPGQAVPQDIQAGLDAALEAQFPGSLEFAESFMEEPAADAWPGNASYNQLADLLQDIDAYYQGQGEEVLVNRITHYTTRVYRVPAQIYYQPDGRAGRYLDPEKDLILFYFSKQDGTPISDGQIVFDGLTDDTWRMFFEPIQQ